MIVVYDVRRCACGANRPYLHLHGSSVRKPYFVRCGLCGHIGPKAYSEKEAVDRWNAERKSDTKKGYKQ